MKASILILFILLSFSFNIANDNLLHENILDIYSSEAIPYLKTFAKNDLLETDSIKSERNINLIRSREAVYKQKILLIESKIKKILKENDKGRNDKYYISTLTANFYKNEFQGLPKSFWESVKAKVSKIE